MPPHCGFDRRTRGKGRDPCLGRRERRGRSLFAHASRQYVASTWTNVIGRFRPFRPVRPGGTEEFRGVSGGIRRLPAHSPRLCWPGESGKPRDRLDMRTRGARRPWRVWLG